MKFQKRLIDEDLSGIEFEKSPSRSKQDVEKSTVKIIKKPKEKS